jgi:hypothetical protein
MHTYRDSIGRWDYLPGNVSDFQRVLDAAVAVFPAPPQEAFADHPYSLSLDQGVGALALIPEAGPDCPFDRWTERQVSAS